MSNGLNSIKNDQSIASILATDSMQDRQEGNAQRNIAETLLKESENYSFDSNHKKEQARQFFIAADALEKMAEAVRKKASELKNNKINKEEAIKEVVEVVGTVLEMPIPKDATPELLDQIADALEEKAKENRRMANDLLIQSEKSLELSGKLKEQAHLISEKDMNLSDIRLKSALFHNEGLKMIFDKLGIFRLDAQYKEQVAYAERKSQEQAKSS